MDVAIIVALVTGIPGLIAAVMVYKQSGNANDVNARAGELQWVRTMKEDAVETREELDRCQDKVRELSRQLTVAQQQADHWAAKYEFARATARRVGLTADQIQALFGETPPGSNHNGSRLVR